MALRVRLLLTGKVLEPWNHVEFSTVKIVDSLKPATVFEKIVTFSIKAPYVLQVF